MLLKLSVRQCWPRRADALRRDLRLAPHAEMSYSAPLHLGASSLARSTGTPPCLNKLAVLNLNIFIVPSKHLELISLSASQVDATNMLLG